MKSKVFCWCAGHSTGLLVGAIVPLVSGCIGFAPVPDRYDAYGQKLRSEDVQFAQAGITSRAEIIARLGTNYVALFRDKALAYAWESGGMGFEWHFVLAFVNGAYTKDTGYGFPLGGAGWRAWFVAFDERGIVVASSFAHLNQHKSLSEHLELWCTRQSKKTRRKACQDQGARVSL